MRYVVISQPRYLPVIPYLQRIHNSDIFVFLDNVQRQARGWENRNKILINCYEKWLTIPVSSSSREKINKAKISGTEWIEKHKKTIYFTYKKAPYFDAKILEDYYSGIEEVLKKTNFSYRDTLIQFIKNLCQIFDMKCNFELASELVGDGLKGNENLLRICEKVGADIYVSGANGRVYGVKEYFEKRSKIKVKFHIPSPIVYKHFNCKEFRPNMCFFDVVFNIGYKETKKLIHQKWKLED
jgi:hypothetical protein